MASAGGDDPGYRLPVVWWPPLVQRKLGRPDTSAPYSLVLQDSACDRGGVTHSPGNTRGMLVVRGCNGYSVETVSECSGSPDDLMNDNYLTDGEGQLTDRIDIGDSNLYRYTYRYEYSGGDEKLIPYLVNPDGTSTRVTSGYYPFGWGDRHTNVSTTWWAYLPEGPSVNSERTVVFSMHKFEKPIQLWTQSFAITTDTYMAVGIARACPGAHNPGFFDVGLLECKFPLSMPNCVKYYLVLDKITHVPADEVSPAKDYHGLMYLYCALDVEVKYGDATVEYPYGTSVIHDSVVGSSSSGRIAISPPSGLDDEYYPASGLPVVKENVSSRETRDFAYITIDELAFECTDTSYAGRPQYPDDPWPTDDSSTAGSPVPNEFDVPDKRYTEKDSRKRGRQ